MISVSFFIVACVACADVLSGDDDGGESVARISDGERDYFVYYGSSDGDAFITPAERAGGSAGAGARMRARRDEHSRRAERVSRDNLVRGYASRSNTSSAMYPEEPALGTPVTFVSEASVEGLNSGSGGGRRANL